MRRHFSALVSVRNVRGMRSEARPPDERIVQARSTNPMKRSNRRCIVRSAAPYPTVAAALRANALALDPDLHLKIAPLRDNMRFYLQASQILATLSSAVR